jgi:general secretion pathway protein L
MAVSALKRGEAIAWIPPRSVGERAFATEPRLLIGIAGPDGLVVQASSLDALPKLRSLRLVFDARDVNILPAKLPPLAGAKLRRALPNVLEDRLLQDPQSCLFAPGPPLADGMRPVAVIDRSWFEFVLGAFERRGLRVTRAIPGQLAVPMQPGADSLMCIGDGIALRTGRHEGIGWPASEDSRGRALALDALLAQRALQRDEPPPDRLVAYVADENWSRPLAASAARAGATLAIETLEVPGDDGIDLLAGREGSGLGRRLADVDWRAWRWPAGWVVAVLLALLVGLNLHWYKMRSESQQMRAALERGFRETFPRVPVVVDPVLQMERELAGLRARSGQSGPADFVPLLARFAQALGPQATGAMTAAEYREGRLVVHFIPALVQAAGVRQQMEQAGRRNGLKIEFSQPGEPVATVSAL